MIKLLALGPRPDWPQPDPSDLLQAGPSCRATKRPAQEELRYESDSDSLPSLESYTPPSTPRDLDRLINDLEDELNTPNNPVQPEAGDRADSPANEGDSRHPDIQIADVLQLTEEQWESIPYNQIDVDNMLGLLEEDTDDDN